MWLSSCFDSTVVKNALKKTMSILSADLNFFSFVLTFKPAVEARLGWSWCTLLEEHPQDLSLPLY